MSGAHEVFDTDLLNKLNGIDAGARTVTSTTVPADVADAGGAAIGTDLAAAHADHVHAHGELAGGDLHAEASTSAAGFMSPGQASNLDELVALWRKTERRVDLLCAALRLRI